jgi:hypothetical protein
MKRKIFGYNNNKNRHGLKIKTPSLKMLWLIVGVIICSIIIVASFDLIFHQYDNDLENTKETKNSNPIIETQVTSIASKFICSCQTKDCAESSLESCTCGNAVVERQFIRDRVEKNVKTADIVIALADKYGFLKPEYKSKYNVDPSKIWKSN